MMTWAILKPRALLKALAPDFFAQPRQTAAQPPEVSNPRGSATIPIAPPDLSALRLRPEVEQSLLDAGMPPESSSIYDGPKRASDAPEEAARKFVLWAQAVGVVGAHTVRTIGTLYWECAEVDHREPVAINRFLRALKKARGVHQDASTADRRRRVWFIDPPGAPKAQVAIAAKIVASTPHLHPRVLQRLHPERDYSLPQVMRAMAHDARRQGRARKQRGSRNVRWSS